MEDIEFANRELLREYIKVHTVKNLGAGREGAVTLLDDGSVVKYLYDDYKPEFALQFKDFDIDPFVFAKSGAFVDGYVAAQFMEYAKGKSLADEIPFKQDIEILSENLEVVSQGIESISEKGVLVKDFFAGNIIYDGNNFKIIDTLPYLFLHKGTYAKENYYEIMKQIYNLLLKEIMKNNIINRKFSYWGNLDYLKNPKLYLLSLKAFIEELIEQKINNLEEAKLALKKS